MKILCTFPGRAGDLLWALPTIRALSRRLQVVKIDLEIAGEFAGLLPLLQLQPYLGRVWAEPLWGMSTGWQPTECPVHERTIPRDYDRVIHLGYRRWPELPLAQETLHTLQVECARQAAGDWTLEGELCQPLTEAELDLSTPWITHLPPGLPVEIVAGWSETHFEYKVGLCELLAQRLPHPPVLLTHDRQSRWRLETSLPSLVGTWLEEAVAIKAAKVFLGCNSGLHVLAVAIGTPVVLVEPMEARHNSIFFPVGWDGPQVQIVKGLDGKPTTDVRHTAELIQEVLKRG